MGTSTYAILCYGFRIKDKSGDEAEIAIDWLGEENDFGGFLAKLKGIESLNPIDNERYEKDTEYQKRCQEYWNKKDELEKQSEIELVTHCENEYPMYILAVRASVKKANHGEPIELDQSIAALAEWREKLHAFCEQAKIPFEEPRFILCTYRI